MPWISPAPSPWLLQLKAPRPPRQEPVIHADSSPAPKVVSQLPRNVAVRPQPRQVATWPGWNPCIFQGGKELKQTPWAAQEAGSANRGPGIGVRGESLGRDKGLLTPALEGDQVLGATLGLTN